jgi:hypothetical protein
MPCIRIDPLQYLSRRTILSSQRLSRHVLVAKRHHLLGAGGSRRWSVPRENRRRPAPECRRLHFVVLPPGIAGVEIGHAIHAKDDSFAVNHELAVAVLQRCLNDPRIAATCNRPA